MAAPARPAFEDERVQRDTGVWGRSPQNGTGRGGRGRKPPHVGTGAGCDRTGLHRAPLRRPAGPGTVHPHAHHPDHRPRRLRPYHRRRGHRPEGRPPGHPHPGAHAPTARTPSAPPSAPLRARRRPPSKPVPPHHLAPRRHGRASARTSPPSRTAPPPPSTSWAPPAWTPRSSPPSPAPRNSPCSAPCATRRTTDTYDLLVVDLPPTPQALALLALPEQLRRYLRRLLPAERQAARALRPVLGRLAGVPMPAEWLYETAARWDIELAAVEAVVEDRAHDRTAGRRARPGRHRRRTRRTPPASPCAACAPTPWSPTACCPTPRPTPGSPPSPPSSARRSTSGRATYDVHELPHLRPRPARHRRPRRARPSPVSHATPPAGRVARRGPPRRRGRPRLAHPAARRRYARSSDLVRRGDELVVTAGTVPPDRRRCRRPCAAAPWTAPPCATANCASGSRRTPDLWPRDDGEPTYRPFG